jgi:predicted CxxxxCH...CXXCH cytochrome family protein
MRPSPSLPPGIARRASFVGLTLFAAVLGACVEPRERPPEGAQHPDGWIEPKSANFHGKDLAARGFPIWECRACHGADYQGGPVGVGCTSANCHTKPGAVEFCGTCHGGEAGPRPSTGAHDKHAAYCQDCHTVPEVVASQGHLNGTADVKFSLHAWLGGAQPSYDPATKTCAGVYCHVDSTPKWETPSGETPCDSCHGAPPSSHTRWAYVATVDQCKNCHSIPPGPSHIDGSKQLNALGCDACHGKGPLGAPAPGLSPTSPGLGAHQRHLDPSLPDRIGRTLACERCHNVPSSVMAEGHLDTSAPADLAFVGDESYAPASMTCVVACHWSKSPGPKWTDDSGAERACGACHGFPPVTLRDGTPHTVCDATLEACVGCHKFDPKHHVDGTVDFKP